MSSNKELDMQRKRLENVLIYLKANGISQKEIAAECNYGQDELSNFKSGKIKYIPDDFLNRLREKYLINPKYIRLESDIMLNILEKKLYYFEKFVTGWSTVTKNDNKFLHISMDPNFYAFLLDIEKVKLFAIDGKDYKAKVERLNEIYSPSSETKEYIVIPRNVFIKLLQDAKEKEKKLSEVIDLLEYTDYIDDFQDTPK